MNPAAPENLQRVEKLLEEKGLERVIILGSANVFFALGTDAAPMAIIGDEPLLIVPRLEYLRALEERVKGRVISVSKNGEFSSYEDGIKGDFYDAIELFLEGIAPAKIGVVNASKENMTKLSKKLGGKPVDVTQEFKLLRRKKTPKEVELMEKAARVAEQAMQKAVDNLETGVTEAEVAAEIISLMVKHGYTFSFYPIVAFGEHAAHPHAKPSLKTLKPGDYVKIDLGAKVGGYCSDMTRTFVYGDASSRQKKIYRAVLEAQRSAAEAIRAGVDAAQPYRKAYSVLKKAGLAEYFNHGLGHGVGVEIHEEPYLSPTYKGKLVAGDVVTNEPGVYMAGYGGVRIEDMLYVDDEGTRYITFFDTFLEV